MTITTLTMKLYDLIVYLQNSFLQMKAC